MLPVVTPEEMAAIDVASPEPVEVLVARAGKAVALRALSMLGGAYGRQVIVVAGKGNNGNDGRDAARRLRQRGARVEVLDAATVGPGERLGPCDLVIDAAYGTGFRGEYEAPDPGGALVLAVDIPSGVNGLTGEAAPGAVRADVTVTFAALKPGLLFPPGRQLAGAVAVADIGLDSSRASTDVVEADDVAAWLPERPHDTHKWRRDLDRRRLTRDGGRGRPRGAGAQRAGAGYVRLSSPGADPGAGVPVEVVRTKIPHVEWDGDVLEGLSRFKALIVGPGSRN